MSTIRITKEFGFEAAHALVGYDGKCKHIHGHSYRLFVTLIGKASCADNPAKEGMMLDFSELKKIVNKHIIDRFDHSLILQENYPLKEELQANYGNTIVFPFRPTCENLLSHFAETLEPQLPNNVQLYSIKLSETASSYAEWYKSDNQ